MALTLVEAEKLSAGEFFKERVQTHGLERVLRYLFHRPKYRCVSALMKWLEEDPILDKLMVQRVEGRAFFYNLGPTLRERVEESRQENEGEETIQGA